MRLDSRLNRLEREHGQEIEPMVFITTYEARSGDPKDEHSNARVYWGPGEGAKLEQRPGETGEHFRARLVLGGSSCFEPMHEN